ncbi:MAG: hypothetical protein QXV01_11145, partial [Candidatus Bathyarchaeia archaeon]
MCRDKNFAIILIALIFSSLILHVAFIKADEYTQRYADALVLVNSASPSASDFTIFIKPYLDYFGIPYSILDISITEVPPDIGKHSLIIVGHKNLDPSHTYLSSTEEGYIVSAVSDGSGLVNFDNVLWQTQVTIQFSCADDAHQYPIYDTFTDPAMLNPSDNNWDEFHWIPRGFPGLFVDPRENPPVMKFYADVPNGEYEVVACLYLYIGASYSRYFYSFTNESYPRDKYIDVTRIVPGEYAEYSLGTVTITDGKFTLYTDYAESSTPYYYGWFWIKLIPRASVIALYDYIQQIFAFNYTQSAPTSTIRLVENMLDGMSEILINCWEDSHQEPALQTFTNPNLLNPSDGEWDEFHWEQRDYPAVFASTAENNILRYGMTFSVSGVPNGEYDVVANLYGPGYTTNHYRYYYSINKGPEMAIDVTHREFAELNLGRVTITDGNFELYTRGADLIEGSDYFYGWAWIKLVPTEVQRHYIIRAQPYGNVITTYTEFTPTGIMPSPSATTLLMAGPNPLLVVTEYGQGKAVQWTSYDFLDWNVLGYFRGLDDVFWRSFVWAARKPFVMQGMLPFVTMRIDDCDGPYDYIDYISGFVPVIAAFMTSGSKDQLAAYVNNGKAICAIHERTINDWGNIDTEAEAGEFWAQVDAFFYNDGNSFPMAKSWHPHYYETGVALASGMRARGVEFLNSEIDFGMSYGEQFDYRAGPYMEYAHPPNGHCSYVIADWSNVYPDFFNVLSAPYGYYSERPADWLEVRGGVSKITSEAVMRIKRSLDSMTFACFFTHEYNIESIGYANFAAITANIVEAIASYDPIYADFDTIARYVRAVVGTSNISSAVYDASYNTISITLSGKADVETKFYVFTEENGEIQSSLV